LHYQRIAPYDIMATFSSFETNLKKIAKTEEEVRVWMRETVGVTRPLDMTLDHLFASTPHAA